MGRALMPRQCSRTLGRLLAVATIAAACWGGAAAQELYAAKPQQLVVDARSVMEAVPDIAIVRLAVIAGADDQDAALLANAEISARVIAKARRAGVEAKDLDVGRIAVSPRWETLVVDGREQRGRRIGYAASNSMTVTIRDIARAGVLIRDLLEEGASTIEDIRFTLTAERMSAARVKVRASALQTARDHAETAALAAGVRLGRLIALGDPPPPGQADLGGEEPEAPSALGPPLVIEPGVIEVHDEVRVVWTLER
jgi:uncharacterized protein YggE